MARPPRRAALLVVITRLIRGGAQSEVLELLARLDRRLFRVSLACHPEGEWVERGASLVDTFHPVSDLVRPISPWHDLRAARRLYQVICRGQFDIVHTHTAKAGAVGRAAARAARIPVIVHTPHGTVFHKSYLSLPAQRAVVFAERAFARWTDCTITKSSCEADEYVKLGLAPRGHFLTIHSGLDLERLDSSGSIPRETRSSLGIMNGRPIVLYPARFAPEKDHASFLRAFEIVLSHVPQAVAVLAGEGPLRPRVEADAAGLMDRGALISLGFRSDLPDLMRAADVCVSASQTEGLPLMVAEALALGRPVVATDAGGTREIVIDGSTGALVPRANPEALADGIVSMLRDPRRANRMAQAGREHVRPTFDARLMVQKIEALYRELLSRKGLAH